MERGFFLTFDRSFPPDPSLEANSFLSCFLLSDFAGVRGFLLLFTFLTSEIVSILYFSLHFRVPVFVSLLTSVCVGGRL